MDLNTLELKFLLRLLAFSGYRTAISQIKINPQTKAADRDRICHGLCSKGLVDFTEEVKQFNITPAGRTLLGLDTSTLPVTPDELLVLRSCVKGLTTPGKVSSKVPAASRQRLIQGLEGRGLLKIRSSQVKEVWLTASGKQFLLTDYVPQGNTPTLSLSMLGSYVAFLRQSAPATASQGQPSTPTAATADDVLERIISLDRQLATDNYLPIFQLRGALPSLSRDRLDQLLYELQRQDRIELSTLQDVTAYSRSQIEAGIPQDIGGALFFISVIG